MKGIEDKGDIAMPVSDKVLNVIAKTHFLPFHVGRDIGEKGGEFDPRLADSIRKEMSGVLLAVLRSLLSKATQGDIEAIKYLESKDLIRWRSKWPKMDIED